MSRQERALLSVFIPRPDRLIRRDQLLAALIERDGESSDRNVDFLVHRLRRKLKDSARSPRFIATQYGEGYVWIAHPAPRASLSDFLVIGPVRCRELVPEPGLSEDILARLRQGLQRGAGPAARVVLRTGPVEAKTGSFRYSLEVTFLDDNGRIDAALALRDERQHRLINVSRLHDIANVADARLAELVDTIMGAIWGGLTLGSGGVAAPTDEPLELRLQDAAVLLAPSHDSWSGIEARLAADRAAHPDDPRMALIWAMHLFAKLLRMEAGDPEDPATYRRTEDEIEALTLQNLRAVSGQPIFELAAAKLLLSVHRGHAELAYAIATAALSRSAAFAAGLPVLAQALAARGDVHGSLSRFDQALELCEPGTEFEIYLLLLKSSSLLAIGDRAGANAVFERVARIKPALRVRLAFLFLEPGPGAATAEQRALLARVDRRIAGRMIAFQHYMVARFFSLPEHARNVMAGPLDQFVRRFGPSVVCPVVAAAYGLA